MTTEPIERALWEASDGGMYETEHEAREQTEKLEIRAVLYDRMTPEINDLLNQAEFDPESILDLFVEVVYDTRVRLVTLLSDFKTEL